MSRHLHRVLMVHNSYRLEGGEDSVVDAEAALLRARGHEVIEYRRHNDEADAGRPLSLAAQALWSQRTFGEVSSLLSLEQPDVVHVHNTMPLVSPSVYWACGRAGVPVVQTLHNFRMACPGAMFLRDGKPCEKCLGRTPWPAVLHGCYRGSRAQTAVVAATVSLHRGLGTWQHRVTRYIALNEFCRDKLVEAGLPAARMSIKPNFIDAPAAPAGPRQGFVYAGRLSAEKGVRVLVEAAIAHAAPQARVIGSGPLAAEVQAAESLVPLGTLASGDVMREMGASRAVLIPSICLESHPRTLVEAFACGTPVIASRLGALPTLVEEGRTGLLFEPGDAADLARVLHWAESHPEEMAGMGQRARAVYEERYTAQRCYETLTGIYQSAVEAGFHHEPNGRQAA